MRKFGLIGYPLGHSFSVNYFREKFRKDSISECLYSNYEIDSITLLPEILEDPDLEGLNVTIPYKESVISFLDKKDPVVTAIGASNCIRISKGEITGFNTDVIGFEKSLVEKIAGADQYALILGTGGSSKAVAWVLQKLGIRYLYVSRNNSENPGQVSYSDLTPEIMRKHTLIINTTPLGMFPDIGTCASVPFEFIGPGHYLFDLVYNPSKTLFLEKGESKGARIKNGADMLAIQAEASWEIWNRSKA
ncbi:MAG TPA: shikimate dehydrogenase [Puia sp.]|jgi:shikimate dehydrogenase